MINQTLGFECIIKEEFYVHSNLKRGAENVLRSYDVCSYLICPVSSEFDMIFLLIPVVYKHRSLKFCP